MVAGAGAQLSFRTATGMGIFFSDQTSNVTPSMMITSSSSSSSSSCSFQLAFRTKRCRFRYNRNPILILCKSSSSSSGSRSTNNGGGGGGDPDRDDYVEASLLLSETLSHHRMRRRGFKEDTWRPSQQSSLPKKFPFSVQRKEFRPDFNLISQSFLNRFQNPTLFLKISCDGDFLLPIVVGEFAIEKLVDSTWVDGKENSPNQFQFMRNLVEKLGYEVNMVKITERVVNTYFARLYFSKPGEKDILSVDARPSDAINVAHRCKAPIYVNKHIVVTDAIRISYGMGRVRDTKSIYDVSLDSAVEGPDFLSQELVLVKNIDLAVKEERYKDAAMWKDKLLQFRKSIHS
ncbi:bifunctional nuclease 2 [Cannabis sativa]|uniref:bifunctional nuclease 2 n=1 Tax=Cannabis sativa TaxID=3483 RepID=UPI0029CA0035|nr:bifunctional nuclease 2 [Cannabis sativa]